MLLAIASSRHVLVVAERTDAQTWKSLRNVESVHLIAPGQLNTYDVLVSDDVIFTEAALQAFLDRTGPADSGLTAEPVEPAVVEAPVAETAKPAAKKAPAKKAAAKPVEAVVTEPVADEVLEAELLETTTDELEPSATEEEGEQA